MKGYFTRQGTWFVKTVIISIMLMTLNPSTILAEDTLNGECTTPNECICFGTVKAICSSGGIWQDCSGGFFAGQCEANCSTMTCNISLVTDTSVTVNEGETATFNVQLANDPGGDISVTVAWQSGDSDITVQSGGELTFTTSNWSTGLDVTLAAAEDDDASNGEATIQLSGTGVETTDVTATEADNDTLGIVVPDPASVTVPEGSSATFNVSLSAQPEGETSVTVSVSEGDADITVAESSATLTFTTENWSTAQTVTLAAAEDSDNSNGQATIQLSATSLTTVSVTAQEDDDDIVIVNPSAVNVPEGSTATFNVKLSEAPADTVSVAIAVASGDADITVQSSSASLSFTTDNWGTDQTVTLEAAEDDDASNGETTIEVSSAGVDTLTVTATETDNDTLEIVPDPTSVSVPEGQTATFNVTLSAKPEGNVSVTAAVLNGDSDITVQSGSLNFTTANWSTAQPVTLAAAEDDDNTSASATIQLSSDSIDNNASVTAKEQDDDIIVTEVSEVTVPEGDTATFGVKLSEQPGADITVTVAPADAADASIAVQSGGALDFTTANWSTYQTVTLSAAADVDAAAGSAPIQLSAEGLDTKEVLATEEDDDELVLEIPESVTAIENDTAVMNVQLSAQPESDVTVQVTVVSGGDADITIESGASLTFTPDNWDAPQQVSIAAAEDADTDNGAATIRVVATGGLEKTVDIPVTESDDDVLALVIENKPETIPEGEPVTFTVRLSMAPLSDVTVAVSLTDGGDTDITLQSAESLTFTASDWETDQNVTLEAAEDDDAIEGSATVQLAATGGFEKTETITVTESENDELKLVASETSVTIDEGTTASFNVKLSAKPESDVTVAVTVAEGGDTDITIQSGASLTFTTENWNTDQPVTLGAAADNTDTDNGTATVQLTASGGLEETKNISVSEQDDDVMKFVTDKTAVMITEGGTAEFQVKLSMEPISDMSVTVARISGDSDVSVVSDSTPLTLTFTSTNWDTYQKVTLEAAEDDDVVGGQATIQLSAEGPDSLDIAVTLQDNDTLTIITDVTEVTVPEEGTATFQVKLSMEPGSDITINLSHKSGDSDITVEAGSETLSFTVDKWDEYQTVTLEAAKDNDVADGEAVIQLMIGDDPDSAKEITATEQDNSVIGDIDCNGSVDLADLILALQILIADEPGDAEICNTDVNNDGKIGVEEVIYILTDLLQG